MFSRKCESSYIFPVTSILVSLLLTVFKHMGQLAISTHATAQLNSSVALASVTKSVEPWAPNLQSGDNNVT